LFDLFPFDVKGAGVPQGVYGQPHPPNGPVSKVWFLKLFLHKMLIFNILKGQDTAHSIQKIPFKAQTFNVYYYFF